MISKKTLHHIIKNKIRVGSTALILLIIFVLRLSRPYPVPVQAWQTPKTIWYQSHEEVPVNILESVIALEDKRFYYHPWIDLIATSRALYQSLIKWNTQWGSTIEQQLIKILEEQYKRNLWRKLYEWITALKLQFQRSKKSILLSYINHIPFSNGIVWWKAACSIYFEKECEYLSDDELSYLFALWQLWINPYRETNQEKIISRSKVLCDILTAKWYTDISQCALLDRQTPLSLSRYQASIDPTIQLYVDSLPPEKQSYFSQKTYQTIENILANTQTQRQQYNAQYCCVTLLDKDGNTISMNTCSDRNETNAWKINTCLAPRQVWSTIKPFLYLYAFQKDNIDGDDTIVDEPVSFDLWDGNTYSPKNFDLSYHGEVTISYALWNSLNVPAIKTLNTIWVPPFLWFLKQQLSSYAPWLDANTKDADNVWLSLALWTYEISPLAFTQLWRMFLPWSMVPGYEQNTQKIVDILRNPQNRVVSFGQDSFLNVPWRAVKTGTSRKFIDWRVCWVHQQKGLTLCIWLWNINNEIMKWPSSEVGSYIWSVIAKEL